MDAPHSTTRARPNEGGFTLIEVMVALVLVAMVGIAAATTMAGVGRAQGTAKVRDRQAAAAQSILARLRNDSTWSHSAACKTTCNLTSVMPTLTSDSSLNYGTTDKFRVTAKSQGVDLPGDGTGGGDKDGVVPDVYRVTVTIDQPLNTAGHENIASLQPLTVSTDVNFSDAAVTGSVNVFACKTTPSIDERAPVATCPASNATIIKMDPPSNFDASHPGSCTSKDCITWVCANSSYRNSYCPSEFKNGGGDANDLIQEQIRALTGGGYHYSLKGTDSNTVGTNRGGYLSAIDGYSTEKNLPPGQYDVKVTGPNGMIPWLSHSLPASGHLSVVAGSTSRYIAMFKPGPAPDIKIHITTTDSTTPWAPQTYDYAYETGVCGLIVPAPIGRTEMAHAGRSPYTEQESCASAGDKFLVIKDAEPGLYLPYLTNTTFTSWRLLANTPGYLKVPGDWSSGDSPEIELGHCDADGRDALIAIYGHTADIPYTNPSTGVTTVSHYNLPDCHSSPGGGPSPPAGGGTRGG